MIWISQNCLSNLGFHVESVVSSLPNHLRPLTFLWSWNFTNACLSTILFYFSLACFQPARISIPRLPEIGAVPGKEVTIWIVYTFLLTVLQTCNVFDVEVFNSSYRLFCVSCIPWVARVLNIIVTHFIQTEYMLDASLNYKCSEA